jgi:hypothetical protein
MSLLVRNPIAEAGAEGPQILVRWDLPTSTGFDRFEVYRKRGSYPAKPGDGLLVFSGRSTYFSDTLLASNVIYYYTIFTVDTSGVYYWDDTTRQKSLSYRTGRSFDVLWDSITSSQTFFDYANRRYLSESTDVVTGAKFNMGGTEVGLGQLERFIKLIGLELDLAWALIDHLSQLWDVDKCDIDFLGYFAELVGLTPEYALQHDQRRSRVKNVVNVYKYKGTRRSYIRIASNTVSHDIHVQDTTRNVFMVGDIIPSLSDPLVAFLRYTPWDIQKVIGSTGWGTGTYGHDKIIVFVDKGDNPFYKRDLSILVNNVTPQFTPLGIYKTFVIWTDREIAVSGPKVQNTTLTV